MKSALRTAAVAWLITAVYYFYQYTLRSAPAVMMPQLSGAFGLSAMSVASLVGLFYWSYSPFSLSFRRRSSTWSGAFATCRMRAGSTMRLR